MDEAAFERQLQHIFSHRAEPLSGWVLQMALNLDAETGYPIVVSLHKATDFRRSVVIAVLTVKSPAEIQAACGADDPRQAMHHLTDALIDVLPSVVMYLMRSSAADGEEVEVARHRALVLSYAGSATASGALPLVGGAGVLGLQTAMLAALAGRYGVAWGTKELATMGSALGVGLIGGQAARLALREALKLVPVVGTVAGAAAGATSGFALTWALGRTAGWWFYQQQQGHAVEDATLRARFAEAMKGGGLAGR